VFRKLLQACAQLQSAFHSKHIAHPADLNVVTRQGSLNAILHPRALLHQKHAQTQQLPLIPQPRRADQATPQSPVIMEALIPQSAKLIKPRPKPSVIMENP